MTFSRLAAISIAVSLSASVYAGGMHGGHGHGDSASMMGHGMSIGEVGNVAEVDREIKIAMFDNYYEPERISVKPGETIRFVIENKGQLVHEFNIGTAIMHAAHQQEMMMMVQHGVIQGGKLNHEMMEMDMGNGHSMKHDDPNSVLLEPGQGQEIIWKFNEKADIEFACNVPGHYQAGMAGEVVFK